MPVFVIALVKRRFRPRGVYALPVTRNFQYGRKLLRTGEEAEAKGKPVKAVVLGRDDDSFRRVERLRKRRKGES